MKLLKLTCVAGALSVLVGCGGGGGGSTSAGGTTLSSATFVDSPVQGLHYTATPSGTTGTTDASGTFNFADGDTVSFKIGGSSGLEIASSKPVAGTPIFVADLPGGAQIAQVLQSFDTGGDANTKLDLSKILSIPANTKTALENHIKDRGDLTAGATVINTALTNIWAATENASALSGVTKPAAKTEAEVQSHLDASVAKLPKKLASIKGSAYLNLVGNDTSTFTLAAFNDDGKYAGLVGDLISVQGTYKQDSDTSVTINMNQAKKLADSTAAYKSFDCKVVATLKDFVSGGVTTTTDESGKDCKTVTLTETHYTLDKGFSKDWLKGKTIDASALTDFPDACLPSKWVINAAGDSVTATNASNQSCSTASFTGKLDAPFASDYPYILTVSGTSGNYKILYVIVKLSGFADRYGSIIYLSTNGGSDYSYNVGRIVKATTK